MAILVLVSYTPVSYKEKRVSAHKDAEKEHERKPEYSKYDIVRKSSKSRKSLIVCCSSYCSVYPPFVNILICCHTLNIYQVVHFSS